MVYIILNSSITFYMQRITLYLTKVGKPLTRCYAWHIIFFGEPNFILLGAKTWGPILGLRGSNSPLLQELKEN